MPEDQVRRFLGLLGLPRCEPTLAFLETLVSAFVSRIPFENVSKLYHWRRFAFAGVPEVAVFLDGVERLGFGGTCYANNYHLFRLLEALGFRAVLGGATMREPNAHAVVRVTLEGREYLLDAGYAAPFLEPMPLDLPGDHVVELGRDRYELHPRDEAGHSRLDLLRDDRVVHGYTSIPGAKTLGDFEGPIAASFGADALFLNSLLLARFRPGWALWIHNLTVVESEGGRTTLRTLSDLEELMGEIQGHFEIPHRVLVTAMEGLGPLQDVWT